ncbi:MAG: anti-FecI sigma factor, FecR [Lacunisphaera sp.]|nr:anti-FecI sigma factor, FecR [Lacunisphaera sp.]
MSAHRHPSRDRIEQEASVWTARLETGALSVPEQQELATWLAADPEHQFILSRYREMCATLAEQVPVLVDPSEVEATIARAAFLSRWRRRAAPLLATAAALAIAATAWWRQPVRVETKPFERHTLALADGSRVELNARTSLEVALGRNERHVKFAHGEALFQVAHDAARPFFVETPHGVVRVTGTQFNVRENSGGGVEVTVLEGTVQVRPAAGDAAPMSLTVGEQAALGAEGIRNRALSSDETQNVIAWRVGQAAFQDAPLAEALARFAPYHAGTITVSPEAAAINVGGRYSLDDLDGFLAAIEQALPVSVLRNPDGAIRVVARPRMTR